MIIEVRKLWRKRDSNLKKSQVVKSKNLITTTNSFRTNNSTDFPQNELILSEEQNLHLQNNHRSTKIMKEKCESNLEKIAIPSCCCRRNEKNLISLECSTNAGRVCGLRREKTWGKSQERGVLGVGVSFYRDSVTVCLCVRKIKKASCEVIYDSHIRFIWWFCENGPKWYLHVLKVENSPLCNGYSHIETTSKHRPE